MHKNLERIFKSFLRCKTVDNLQNYCCRHFGGTDSVSNFTRTIAGKFLQHQRYQDLVIS